MRTILAGSLLCFTLLALRASAQDSTVEEQAREIEEFEPAVSSEDLSQMDSTATEDPDPAVPATAVAGEVKRTAGSTGVMDRIELERTEITGNQELPKVLYIVPWQKSQAGELVGKPVNTLLEEVLAPIDRSEFTRQVDYYDDLYGKEEE